MVDPANDRYFTASQNHLRVSGDLGATLRIWGAANGPQHGILFAQYCSIRSLAAIDFARTNAAILHPENADAYQGGLGASRLSGKRSTGRLRPSNSIFANLVVNQTDASPRHTNAGRGFAGADDRVGAGRQRPARS